MSAEGESLKDEMGALLRGDRERAEERRAAAAADHRPAPEPVATADPEPAPEQKRSRFGRLFS